MRERTDDNFAVLNKLRDEVVAWGETREWAVAGFMPAPKRIAKDDALERPMPGVVFRVLVEPGQHVYRRQPLVVIESMKMESVVASPRDAEVAGSWPRRARTWRPGSG